MSTVEALQYHTHQGVDHQAGEQYDVDELSADNLVVQGKAKRVDSGASAPARPSQPVEPLMTDDFAPKP